MSAAARLGGFAVVLAVVLGASLGIGRLVGPLDDAAAGPERTVLAPAADHAAEAVGLGATDGIHTLRLLDDRLDVGRSVLRFQVLGADGAPLTAYDEQHERDLHLVVVRRDLTGFQHVHPSLDAAGTWAVPVELRPGSWRVIADFAPSGGEVTVLGADLAVPGAFRPAGLGADTAESDVAGYRVRLDGVAPAGEESRLTATIDLAGAPVTDLQPYLGAHGHLVALRAGDLGYQHVHPVDDGAGPGIGFTTTFATGGRYRLFLDFRHDGLVRTVPFTVTVPDAPAAATSETPASSEEGGHDDGPAHDH